MANAVARRILDAVERAGILLVHDRALPSVTALVAGEPVAGSWWAHPKGKLIYNALVDLDDAVATVKLLAGKQTLVARRLWPELVAVGSERAGWQTAGLGHDAHALLARVGATADPLAVAKDERGAAEALERRLLAYPVDIHTERGHHVKGLQSWASWAAARGVVAATADPDAARRAFAALAPAGARLPF